MRIAFILLMNTLIIICGAKVSSKGFSSKSIANDAWVIENEFTEYPTMELCRTACLNAEDDCKAFAFNSEDRKCQFGTVADDPVYLTSGVNVHIDREIGLPQKYPHIAFFDVDQYEFSSATEGILPSKSFPEFAPHVANRDMIAVMVYDNRGFFACTFNDDPDYCGFNAFGSAIWEPWPMYSSEPSPRSNPAHVQLGSTSMWVLGGRYHDTTEIFSDGAWKFGPDLPTAECSRRELFNAVKISNAEVLIFGGSCGGVAHTETSYTYNFATGEWIRRGDLSEGKVGTSFLNDVITLTNGTKVVVAVGGYDITNLVNLRTVELYNADTHKWVKMKDFPWLELCCRPVGVIQNRVFLFGSSESGAIFEYKAEDDEWMDTGKLVPVANAYCKPIVFNL